MASNEDALASLMKNAGKDAAGIKELTKSMKELNNAKKVFMAAGDPKGLLAVRNMSKDIAELISTTEDYIKVSKLIKKAKEEGRDLDEDEIKTAAKISKAHEQAAKVTIAAQKTVIDSTERMKSQQARMEADLLKNFRTNTLLGKSFGMLSSGVAGFAVKLGFLSLATKALNRHMKSAEIQQNILIQNFRGLSKDTTVLGSKTLGFTASALKMSEALASTEATAQRMGVSTEYVSESFTKFARIAGTDSPKVLKTLSEGAITVSRSLGITVPEAVDFVSTRMDKFGGSAASAIASLNNMRVEAERINKSFGRTVIRGDDVARTVQDISKQTTIYAIDQRYVGNILNDNIAKLQANGDSYEQASKKAKSFTEAVTGKAPEWMKVFSAQDIYSQIADVSPEQFVSQFGSELEAAKPGLTKEVQSILNDKNMGKYSKMMLLQEMLSGTTVGVQSMNKQILKLANHPQGVALIAKQFGVTLAEAQGMVTQAQAMEEQTKVINKLNAQGIVSLREKFTLGGKEYTLSQDQADEVAKAGEIAKQTAKFAAQKTGQTIKASELEAAANAARKAALQGILDQKSQEQNIENDLARMKNEELANEKAILGINAQITELAKRKASLQAKLATAQGPEKAAIEKEIARVDKMIKGKELDRTRYESKAAEAEGTTAGLKTVEEINKALLTQFEGYSVNSGGAFKAMITELSDTKSLLIAAGIMGIGKYLLGYTGLFKRMEMYLAKIAAGVKGGIEIDESTGGPKGGGMQGPQPKKSRIGSMKRPAGGYGAEFGKSLDFGKVAAVAGTAMALKTSMDMLTATYDSNGQLIDKSTKLFGVNLDKTAAGLSALGTGLSGMPGKLGKLGGSLGMLSSAWELGATLGKGANAAMDYFGITADAVGGKMADLAASSDGLMGKFLRMVGPASVETKESGKAADSKLLASVMKKGLSEKEAKDAIAGAEKEKISIPKYLAKMGKLPSSTGALTGATIPKNVGADLNKAAATAAIAATETATAATAATATAPADTGSSTMAGSFVGSPSADGSIMLRVDNMLGVLAKSGAMMKQKTIRPSG